MGVAPHDDLSGCRSVRRVDSERDDLFRIGNQFRLRVQPPNQIGRGRGVGSVGDNYLYRARVVLRHYRVDRRPDGRLGVPDRDENGNRWPTSASGLSGQMRREDRTLLHVLCMSLYFQQQRSGGRGATLTQDAPPMRFVAAAAAPVVQFRRLSRGTPGCGVQG